MTYSNVTFTDSNCIVWLLGSGICWFSPFWLSKWLWYVYPKSEWELGIPLSPHNFGNMKVWGHAANWNPNLLMVIASRWNSFSIKPYGKFAKVPASSDLTVWKLHHFTVRLTYLTPSWYDGSHFAFLVWPQSHQPHTGFATSKCFSLPTRHTHAHISPATYHRVVPLLGEWAQVFLAGMALCPDHLAHGSVKGGWDQQLHFMLLARQDVRSC